MKFFKSIELSSEPVDSVAHRTAVVSYFPGNRILFISSSTSVDKNSIIKTKGSAAGKKNISNENENLACVKLNLFLLFNYMWIIDRRVA